MSAAASAETAGGPDPAGHAARLRPSTTVVHAGLSTDPATGAVVPPIVSTSIYDQRHFSGRNYGRDENPTWERLEALVGALEGGDAVVVASGMAAISAVLDLVPVGGTVVAPAAGYSGTRILLRHLVATERVRARFVDTADTDAVRQAVAGADLLLLETITNPLLTVPDLDACAEAAHAAGARVAVDSTVTTPLLVRPLDHGADVVVHSLTKYVAGHSDLVLGALACRDREVLARLRFVRQERGGIPGTFEAWLALRGGRTLALRHERQCASAAVIAERLETHPAVAAVLYPGRPAHPQHERARALFGGAYGGLVSFVPHGGGEAADAALARLRLWTVATSLGGVESTIERRDRYDLDAEIAPPGLVRASAGIEDVDDLWDDLAAGLGAAAQAGSG